MTESLNDRLRKEFEERKALKFECEARAVHQIKNESQPAPKSRIDLIPAESLIAVGYLLALYEDNTSDLWRKKTSAEHIAAALRHLFSHLSQYGSPIDAESHHPHLAHAAARVLYAIARYEQECWEENNEPRK